jgi:hypothetical protein
VSACRGCGKPLVWGITDDGKKIPLDPSPPVYWVYTLDGADHAERILPQVMAHIAGADPEAKAMVSHFATCPQANLFSRSASKRSNEGSSPK